MSDIPSTDADAAERTGQDRQTVNAPLEAAAAGSGNGPDAAIGVVPPADAGTRPPLAASDVDGPDADRDHGPGASQTPDEATSGSTLPAEPEELETPRQLHPLPRGLVELYGLLAVLVVLVPEWMAGGALFGFREGRQGSELPAPSGAWRRLPELRLASLNLAGLRQLARERGLRGYGRQNRDELTVRLLRRLKAQP